MRSVKDKPFYCQSAVDTIPFQGSVLLQLEMAVSAGCIPRRRILAAALIVLLCLVSTSALPSETRQHSRIIPCTLLSPALPSQDCLRKERCVHRASRVGEHVSRTSHTRTRERSIEYPCKTDKAKSMQDLPSSSSELSSSSCPWWRRFYVDATEEPGPYLLPSY